MEQITSRCHAYNSIRFNVTPGLVLVGKVYPKMQLDVFFLFEVGFDANAYMENKVKIEPGSAVSFSRMHAKVSSQTYIDIKDCSWPTEEELEMYRNSTKGI